MYNSFGDMNSMHQIYSISIGIFPVYIFMYFIFLGFCVHACVYIAV